ncbi:hypothetical protein ACJMK2_008886 [Sinanodonta woodiana]|uniref:Apextrin C-terminal domain-containing protein n=1 Tax=Sinanodonta woodiana TaxID=1069815 RepID=A0ABD3VAR8_SINWO
MQWPAGDYAMLKPSSGCPVNVAENWREGYRKEYGKGTYNYSTPLDLFGEFTEEYMKFFFCVHKSVKNSSLIPRYQTYWEPGRYCIIRSNGTCPNGFKSGYAQMDDSDNKVNLLQNGGILPDGYFANDTGLYFCCRDDGLVTNDIVMPRKNPFVLYMVTGETKCQAVKGMTSSIQYLVFNDDKSGNRVITNGTLPTIKIENNNTMLFLCHYKPVECEITGCTDKDGEDVPPSSEHTKNCVTKNNVQYTVHFLTVAGCSVESKCKMVGEEWSVLRAEGCVRQVCQMQIVNNTEKFLVKDISQDCTWMDSCKAVNSTWKHGCITYRCDLSAGTDHYKLIVQPTEFGCSDGDKCYKVGEKIARNCYEVVCKLSENKTTVYFDILQEGCKWNGKCKSADVAWSEDCLSRKCVVVVNETHVQRQVMSTVEGCQTVGSSDCHAIDSNWTETQNNSCTRLTCTQNGQALRTKVLERLCQDYEKKCHPVGASGFQAEIQGTVRTNCSCLARESGVMVQCPG